MSSAFKVVYIHQPAPEIFFSFKERRDCPIPPSPRLHQEVPMQQLASLISYHYLSQIPYCNTDRSYDFELSLKLLIHHQSGDRTSENKKPQPSLGRLQVKPGSGSGSASLFLTISTGYYLLQLCEAFPLTTSSLASLIWFKHLFFMLFVTNVIGRKRPPS